MENMHRDFGPSAYAYTPEQAFENSPQDIDYALNEHQISKIARSLAQIRLKDSSMANINLEALAIRTTRTGG